MDINPMLNYLSEFLLHFEILQSIMNAAWNFHNMWYQILKANFFLIWKNCSEEIQSVTNVLKNIHAVYRKHFLHSITEKYTVKFPAIMCKQNWFFKRCQRISKAFQHMMQRITNHILSLVEHWYSIISQPCNVWCSWCDGCLWLHIHAKGTLSAYSCNLCYVCNTCNTKWRD